MLDFFLICLWFNLKSSKSSKVKKLQFKKYQLNITLTFHTTHFTPQDQTICLNLPIKAFCIVHKPNFVTRESRLLLIWHFNLQLTQESSTAVGVFMFKQFSVLPPPSHTAVIIPIHKAQMSPKTLIMSSRLWRGRELNLVKQRYSVLQRCSIEGGSAKTNSRGAD